MPVETIKRMQEELPEWPMTGPFGGIQSEIPSSEIERHGLDDSLNIIFRKALATVRPGYTALSAAAGRILGIVDFFNSSGTRVQAVISTTSLQKWDSVSQTWVSITGTLTGPSSSIFAWTIVNNKLLFCQGVDKVKSWDGIAGTFADANANAVPARFLMELDTHLVVGYTVEAATTFPLRIRWTAAGDPTDWVSANAGINDILGDLGNINGLSKIYQQGFAFHYGGLTQIIPTGIGTKPFDFRPFGAKGKGNRFPYSLAAYGDKGAAYVGSENVFFFDGTESIPIGSRPVDGRRSVGARSRILSELALVSDPNQVFGFISSDILANDFIAYWLVAPGGSTWVYNFDEENWTRFSFDRTPSVVGRFYNPAPTRINDLVGTIDSLSTSIDGLNVAKPLDSLLIGFTDATPGLVDFSNFSESAWSITGPQQAMGDKRHNKDITRFRLVYKDIGSVTFTLSVTNEKGKTESHSIAAGSGSGLILERVVPFHISGLFLQWKVSGSAGAKASFVEFAPIYSMGGEYKN